ncbi:hypothetical protein QFC24_003000 [Naganishia onofrii]|uniref:Uncharacterized protein n=1 Tax=Naganishia onofrii TaxID=1851511 RepID=A0ACC2XLA5_9TREE|nr:hypothetical protein QFC24_003000 [Naganishia onofrii]
MSNTLSYAVPEPELRGSFNKALREISCEGPASIDDGLIQSAMTWVLQVNQCRDIRLDDVDSAVVDPVNASWTRLQSKIVNHRYAQVLSGITPSEVPKSSEGLHKYFCRLVDGTIERFLGLASKGLCDGSSSNDFPDTFRYRFQLWDIRRLLKVFWQQSDQSRASDIVGYIAHVLCQLTLLRDRIQNAEAVRENRTLRREARSEWVGPFSERISGSPMSKSLASGASGLDERSFCPTTNEQTLDALNSAYEISRQNVVGRDKEEEGWLSVGGVTIFSVDSTAPAGTHSDDASLNRSLGGA